MKYKNLKEMKEEEFLKLEDGITKSLTNEDDDANSEVSELTEV